MSVGKKNRGSGGATPEPAESVLARPVSAEDLEHLFRILLGRGVGNAKYTEGIVGKQLSIAHMMQEITRSPEFTMRMRDKIKRESFLTNKLGGGMAYHRHNGPHYGVPDELRVEPDGIRRVLLLGHCFLEAWPKQLERRGISTPVDFMLVSTTPPSAPPHPFDAYSFQIAQIPFRRIVMDRDYAEWLRAPADDGAATERLLATAFERIDFWLKIVTVWSAQMPTFLTNFMLPQYSVNGRYASDFGHKDNLQLIMEINTYLEGRIRAETNTHLLDIERLSAMYGKRFFQDDAVWIANHGGLIGDFDFPLDRERLIKAPALSDHHAFTVDEFIESVWREAVGMYRTLRQIDQVKMVCVDLDDTLWRGVLADSEGFDPAEAIEGWPLGMVEALLALKRRGVILALLSKNDLGRVTEIWRRVMRNLIQLEDFAILKVNWNPKVQNIQEAMEAANLLPRSVVFLDDNPVERAAVAEAFPEIRVITASHYYWKRILLWSAETQTTVLTRESAQRTDLIKAQVVRESERRTLSRDDFLANLDLRVAFHRLTNQADGRFARSLELLNKTNQFNTTGRRWSAPDLDAACRQGLVLIGEAADRHTEYGLILVAIAVDGCVEQIVMSCRVISLDVEIASVAILSEILLRDSPAISARATETDANLLSRDLYAKCGWTQVEGGWRTDHVCPLPPHITVTRPVGDA